MAYFTKQDARIRAAQEFTEQESELLCLLWDSMKRDPEHKDRVRTGYGTKTKLGLLACIRSIMQGRENLIGG